MKNIIMPCFSYIQTGAGAYKYMWIHAYVPRRLLYLKIVFSLYADEM